MGNGERGGNGPTSYSSKVKPRYMNIPKRIPQHLLGYSNCSWGGDTYNNQSFFFFYMAHCPGKPSFHFPLLLATTKVMIITTHIYISADTFSLKEPPYLPYLPTSLLRCFSTASTSPAKPTLNLPSILLTGGESSGPVEQALETGRDHGGSKNLGVVI